MTLDEPLSDGLIEQVDALKSQVANLELALESARQIGAAIGIIMATERVTQDVAFGLLMKASNRSHMKLREVADTVVETGILTTGSSSPMPGQRPRG